MNKIWEHSIPERLALMLKQCGVKQAPQDLPDNLVCSTKFLKDWIASGQNFESYSAKSPYVFFLCTSNEMLNQAKKALFKDSKKETDGWVSQKLNAIISIPISKFLSRHAIHPNWITLLNLPVALLAPWLFLKEGYFFTALSGLVFQLGSILDGCDGEIARTKLQVTKFGGWLDTAVDNFSYLAFFYAVGLRQSIVTAHPFYFQIFIVGLGCLFTALITTYVGMHRMGAQTHHAYRQAFIALSQSSPILRAVNRFNFLSKRENFALGIMFLCFLNLKSPIYYILLSTLFLYSAIVIGTFPKIYKGASHA